MEMTLLAQAMSASTAEQLAPVVEQALSSPGVHHFGELLDVARQVSGSEVQQRKLELFAWGTYDGWARAGKTPPLRDEQIFKLRQLTLVSLAIAHKNELPYSAMQQALEIRDVRELEDLVLRAVYDGVVTGKLDQRQNRFRVTATVGRDVPVQKIAAIAQTLALWEARSEALLHAAEQHAQVATRAAEDAQRSREGFEATLKTMRENAAAMLDEDGGAAGMDVVDPVTAMMMSSGGGGGSVGHSAFPEKKRRARPKRDVYQTKDRS